MDKMNGNEEYVPCSIESFSQDEFLSDQILANCSYMLHL